MSKYASGKFALRISDRDGQAYPYNEMVQEWTGMWVHQSEYEPKSPLLDPKNHPVDYEALEHSKGQVVSVTIPLGGVYIDPAIGQNIFDTQMQTIQQWNPIPAPGAYETVQVRTMKPLSASSQANQDTIMNSAVGIATVSIT